MTDRAGGAGLFLLFFPRKGDDKPFKMLYNKMG